MFSGIIETTTSVLKIEKRGGNKLFSFENKFGDEIYIDQSIAHNGVCLTVIEFNNELYKVEAIADTLEVSNLDTLSEGDLVNLERSVTAHQRMDGHIVQGHVDDMVTITDITDKDGSWEIQLEIPIEKTNLIIPKGSVTLNGISLTIQSQIDNKIAVAIIPYTYNYTNVKNWKPGDKVNIEYDVLGKYIVGYMQKINAR